MKKIVFLVLGIFLMSSSLVFAGHGKCYRECGKDCKAKHEKYMDKKMKKMTKKLDLTPKQQEQIKKIKQQKWDKKHQVYVEKHKKMEAIRKDYRAKVGAVLNAEQNEKYDEIKKKKRKKRWCRKKCPCCH